MKQEKIVREFTALSPELQTQVMDFIAFLRTRYKIEAVGKPAKRTKLSDEPFIGVWRNRKDMQDSTTWVREMRQKEWMNGNG